MKKNDSTFPLFISLQHVQYTKFMGCSFGKRGQVISRINVY